MKKQIRCRAQWKRGAETICGEAAAYFPFFDGKRHVVSLVGGGGKSTLLEYLAENAAARGMRTVIMTTTRMACPAHVCKTMEDCRARWAQGEYAACGERTENGKFRAPDDALLGELLEEADMLLVEADGAHMRACKAPAEHEPVILPESDIVIGVMGVEVLGGEIDQVCHRPQHVCALLGCTGDHALTAADMAEILLCESGTRKNVGTREFHVVLNKCDDSAHLENGRRIMAELEKRGHINTVLTSFAKK